MAVNFTTNIGLAKPTESELAKEWARNSTLVADNNSILIDEMDFPITTYSPVLTASPTPPSFGVGTCHGVYCEFQGMVFGNYIIDFLDPGVTSGNGEYAVSLPFPADPVFHNVGSAFNDSPGFNSVIGEAYCYDASAIAGSGALACDVVTVGGISYLRMITEAYTSPPKTVRLLRNGLPFTVANQDRLNGNFIYKRV